MATTESHRNRDHDVVAPDANDAVTGEPSAPSGPGERGAPIEGEGSYTAGRRYNEEQQEFVKANDTERLAREARPQSAAEARDQQEAEKEGRAHARPDPEASDRDNDAPVER